ncbi:hypothetical protein [Oceaniradius stylonematis]|uniref:hypothetical protein n=1 Tax=Oceaniradius stylonematis TaxID=2184161 RepID=UPI00273DD28E|nr:hypothetical protein [Oceaniradius stylonematis]
MNRRQALIGALFAAVLTISHPASAAKIRRATTLANKAPPSKQDIERYYAFLWLEMRALAREIGCDTHDTWLVQRTGAMDWYERRFAVEPASSRAQRILSALS